MDFTSAAAAAAATHIESQCQGETSRLFPKWNAYVCKGTGSHGNVSHRSLTQKVFSFTSCDLKPFVSPVLQLNAGWFYVVKSAVCGQELWSWVSVYFSFL